MLSQKKGELEGLRKITIAGVMARAKAQWYEEGEKSSKYFLNLEKRNAENSLITRLVDKNETIIEKQEDIKNNICIFYKELYNNNTTDDTITTDKVLNSCTVPVLSTDQQTGLEGKITLEEATIRLRLMKHNKTPGSDGFSVEFFKVFWKSLGKLVVNSLNHGFDSGTLSITQRQGVITLIPKGNKPREYVQNFRPISLLNVVYKIGSSCIAERMKSVLHCLINTDQQGFMSGRYIGECTRCTYDMLLYTKLKNIPGLLLTIDFEKAFDTVSHQFINKVMKRFNFGKDMIKWIEIFYNKCISSVLVNGHPTEFFDVKRGCRQGDPLSPYLFLLCIEILAQNIRMNKGIKGINVEGNEMKVSLYADDLTLYMDGSDESILNLMDELDCFENISGLRVNYQKTCAIWIGSMRKSEQILCAGKNFKWSKDGKFNLLGIDFCTDVSQMPDLNYYKCLDSMKKSMSQWSRRYLTPIGRLTIVKSLIIPKINHIIMTIPNPSKAFLKELNTLLFKFIWKSSEKISRAQLSKIHKHGGIKMVNIEKFFCSLKISWLRRYLKSSGRWKLLANFFAPGLCNILNGKNISMGCKSTK